MPIEPIAIMSEVRRGLSQEIKGGDDLGLSPSLKKPYSINDHLERFLSIELNIKECFDLFSSICRQLEMASYELNIAPHGAIMAVTIKDLDKTFTCLLDFKNWYDDYYDFMASKKYISNLKSLIGKKLLGE